MFNKKEIKRFFSKPAIVEYRGERLKVWSRTYWFTQQLLINIPYKYYYNKFSIHGWENVPENKPVIFAISHRNAFMDSLAFTRTKNTQVWQLARADAWSNKMLGKIFYVFHMLPVWREQDGEDIKTINQPTFDACGDILAKNGMVGIYPEGNCINEEHIRPLKKGICRIAFSAEERYDFNLDVHIIPVTVSYTDAEKFKKWQLINFGEPILLKNYSELYKRSPGHASTNLKDDIEAGMKKVSLHIEHSQYYDDILYLANMFARDKILNENEKYEPVNKLYAEKEIVAHLEKFRQNDDDGMKQLSDDLHEYQKLMGEFNFRENTFDKAKHNSLSIIFMFLYFLFFSPVFLFGVIINYIPYIIPKKYVEKKIKQRIFWSSIKYAIGVFLFPVYYLILTLIIRLSLGSTFSALIFLISFPISGNIAFYYWYDLKKWRSVLRYKKLMKSGNSEFKHLLSLREKILNTLYTMNNTVAEENVGEIINQ